VAHSSTSSLCQGRIVCVRANQRRVAARSDRVEHLLRSRADEHAYEFEPFKKTNP